MSKDGMRKPDGEQGCAGMMVRPMLRFIWKRCPHECDQTIERVDEDADKKAVRGSLRDIPGSKWLNIQKIWRFETD